jgi:1-deoxy-D-xylulose-5-phosphate synthase
VGFENLRQAGGLSGYPNREESVHDFVENSHASTILSYAHGLAVARAAGTAPYRHIVSVIGDGSMTGGMAYEALNNLGHAGTNVIIILNDNGRSYAPTVSRLSESLTKIRLNPVYMNRQRRIEELAAGIPVVGRQAKKAVDSLKAGVREYLQPPAFFESLGVRYQGPIDGHSIRDLEEAMRSAIELGGPVVLHVLTTKGKGYPPAEDDDEKHLHDAPVFDPRVGPPKAMPSGYTQAFAEAIIKEAEQDKRIVAITAAMPGPTGLLPYQDRFPDRFLDVGIAEQHAVTTAAGMAMGGLKPVAWDQVVYDVALHRLGVVFCLDRAGITGDDGASHHGVYDMALFTKVPGMTVLAPSSFQELGVMLHDALELDGPVMIRYPKGAARQVSEHDVGVGLRARQMRVGASACILAVGKMVAAAEKACDELAADGIEIELWDVRCCTPLDVDMLAAAQAHQVVITCEDGLADGGVGALIADRIASATCVVEVMGVPTKFLPHGKPDRILANLGLDATGIAAQVRSHL